MAPPPLVKAKWRVSSCVACVNIYLKKGFTPFVNDSQGRKLWKDV